MVLQRPLMHDVNPRYYDSIDKCLRHPAFRMCGPSVALHVDCCPVCGLPTLCTPAAHLVDERVPPRRRGLVARRRPLHHPAQRADQALPEGDVAERRARGHRAQVHAQRMRRGRAPACHQLRAQPRLGGLRDGKNLSLLSASFSDDDPHGAHARILHVVRQQRATWVTAHCCAARKGTWHYIYHTVMSSA